MRKRQNTVKLAATFDRAALIEAALAGREHAYARYSDYKVGAAVVTASGEVFTGCNVENASYGLTNCAERTAVFKAVSEGHQDIVALALCLTGAGSPCGACRQVLYEFSPHMTVLIVDEQGKLKSETTATALLPAAFSLPG